MNLFEKITQSPEALADYISADKDNGGCGACDYKDDCTGKKDCVDIWLKRLGEDA